MQVDDDPKMHPKKIPQRRNAQIPGAEPHAMTKPRGTNPLDPEYKVPYKEPDPVYVPKFIRDAMNVEDIEARQRGAQGPRHSAPLHSSKQTPCILNTSRC